MRSYRLICLLGMAFAAASTAAGAQDAYTAHQLNLRTGPDRSYPPVAQMPAGAPVQIMGCLSDWSWCDVVFDDDRGWAYAPGLTYVYQGARVPFYSYAPSFGIPIEAFSLGVYWDRYYRGKPWYSQRSVWLNRRLAPHRRPPGPPPHAGPPPRARGRAGTNAHLPVGPSSRAESRRAQIGRPGTAQPGNGRPGAEQRGAEQRGPQQRGSEQRGSEQRGQAQRKPSEKGPQKRPNSGDDHRGDQTQDNPR